MLIKAQPVQHCGGGIICGGNLSERMGVPCQRRVLAGRCRAAGVVLEAGDRALPWGTCGQLPGAPAPGRLSPELRLRLGRGRPCPPAPASAAGSGREEIREALSAGR